MPDWLFEGRLPIYLALAAGTLILLILWVKVPRRVYLIGTGVGLLLLGLYYLLDRLVVTPREEIVETIQLMAGSVAKKNLEPAFVHFSERFRSPRGHTREQLRSQVEDEMNRGQVTSVNVWGFEILGPVERGQPAKVSFLFKVHGLHEMAHLRCDSVFAYEPPHGWCMQSCRIFDPIQNDNEIDVGH